jgi:inhibitor of KinA sporulation pathway (predicted exonuclease)
MESVYEKQLYIKPESHHSITPYCRVLTGITEETVENACNLQQGIVTVRKHFNFC